MKIEISNKSKQELPAYSAISAAGMDRRDNLEEEIVLRKMQRSIIKSGLFLEIPAGYEEQILPGSRLALNKGIKVLNLPGTINAEYGGEVYVILITLSETHFIISD